MNYDFIFSVVMSVYNVEQYLEEAMNSLLIQTLGFEHIQVIMVDDGSTDSSGRLCDEWAEKYPDNIMVVHKENGGLSSARMAGIPNIRGKYVSFLDPDDKLSQNTFERVNEFFEEYDGQVDVCSIPLLLFGTQNGPHPLNDKFKKGTRLIDLSDECEWRYVQLSAASSFYTREAVDIMDFDTEMVTAEDAKENIKILIRKQKLGVVANAKYYYRRYGAGSLVGSAQMKKGWYTHYLDNFSYWALDYCREQLGYVPKFVQYTVMYDLQWKYRPQQIPDSVLTDEEKQEYQDKLFNIVRDIDDDVIWSQRQLYTDHKLYLMNRKYGEDTALVFDRDNVPCCLYGNKIRRGFDQFTTFLHFAGIKDGILTIEGAQTWFAGCAGEPQRIDVRWKGHRAIAEFLPYQDRICSAGLMIGERKYFSVKIDLSMVRSAQSLQFWTVYPEFTVRQNTFVYKKYMPVTMTYMSSFYYKDGYVITPRKNGLTVSPCSKRELWKHRRAFFRVLWNRAAHAKEKPVAKAICCRKLYYLLKPFTPKNIWLITDKSDRADDNGEAFFRYAAAHRKELKCTPVFAIGKTSPDFERMKKIGKVIPYMSWRYKLTALLAKHTVTAYSHNELSLPFEDYTYLYGDLIQDNKIIFLQHGIIKDDLSIGLNRFHKNFARFVTSTKKEWESVAYGNYGYDPSQIIMTGLPRYDELEDHAQKLITIMPTWLRSLFGDFISKESRWVLLPGFEESAYYRFYEGLINSQTLLDAADRLGYTVRFLPHPVLFPYIDRFHADPRVRILGTDTRYKDVFAESALITTDYSSVAFDFAYLKKPVVYTQFEENHYQEGYFNYKTDGFGEIENTVESTVARLIEYMENGCRMKPEYLQRVDSFFAWHDRNNCRRVAEKILELDRQ